MIDLRLKDFFFDRQRVIDAVDAGTRKVLSKFGAFVRTRAKTSMRKRRGASPAGTPPNSHTGLIRNNIFFAYEPTETNVVIGPVLIGGRGHGEAPKLNEHGGTVIRKKKGRAVVYNYPQRAFMQPAFDEEKKNLPALWANSIK